MPTRNRFEKELETLNLDIIKMGSMVEKAIDDSIKSLMEQNIELAKTVIEGEKLNDMMEKKIESEALKLLLRQQPVAGDLRAITTALKIVSDMERIGDQARDICEIVLHFFQQDYRPKLVKIPQMAEITKQMVKLCVDSFVNQNMEMAQEVINMDDKIDDLFEKVKEDMIQLIKKDSVNADAAIYLMMVAKYFEKIGDHAENIAEWVQFCKTGEHKHTRLI